MAIEGGGHLFLLETEEIYLVLIRTHINPKVFNGLKKERKRKTAEKPV